MWSVGYFHQRDSQWRSYFAWRIAHTVTGQDGISLRIKQSSLMQPTQSEIISVGSAPLACCASVNRASAAFVAAFQASRASVYSASSSVPQPCTPEAHHSLNVSAATYNLPKSGLLRATVSAICAAALWPWRSCRVMRWPADFLSFQRAIFCFRISSRHA